MHRHFQNMARLKVQNKNTKAHHEEKKTRQREAMRRLRESRRQDPEKYEEDKRKERERYYRRKEAGQIKTIDQMSEREKRNQRKEWRNRSKKHYLGKKNAKELELKLQENSPPATPIPEELMAEAPYDEILQERYDGRKRQGRSRRRKHVKALRK
ncbi:unnamed protein product [Acanthoscelides obtectus]|uniref:Uncharacterized protein n=1 Tax=Acanthoscelides obtectus TaxID=200917 RepID=A0A9P0KK84_ACAOB|nr:unnamed protein product [Acanthoscelides obtectus]CAK1627848.1 hypothetical protein AOBTE_LOCUS4860 [Acanthoscelides obtectus]